MRKILILMLAIFATSIAEAQQGKVAIDTLKSGVQAEPKGRFLPMKRRIDRQVNKNQFVYKGEVLMGVTASYGTLTSDNSDLLLFLEHINADGAIATVKPYVGYAYRDNRVIGVRFGYRHITGNLGNLSLNLGEQNDIALSVQNMGYLSNNYNFAIFHRNYVALDPRGRFGLFADVEAGVMTGKSIIDYNTGEEKKSSVSNNFKAELTFNPGVAVYVFPNVCATLSFGLGGIHYTRVEQCDAAGEATGMREASKMRFRLNLADINLGFTFHLWNKKKE